MDYFRWTKSSKGSTDGYDVVKELVTRHTSFTRGRWHHVVISLYQSKQKSNETVIDRNDSCKVGWEEIVNEAFYIPKFHLFYY